MTKIKTHIPTWMLAQNGASINQARTGASSVVRFLVPAMRVSFDRRGCRTAGGPPNKLVRRVCCGNSRVWMKQTTRETMMLWIMTRGKKDNWAIWRRSCIDGCYFKKRFPRRQSSRHLLDCGCKESQQVATWRMKMPEVGSAAGVGVRRDVVEHGCCSETRGHFLDLLARRHLSKRARKCWVMSKHEKSCWFGYPPSKYLLGKTEVQIAWLKMFRDGMRIVGE